MIEARCEMIKPHHPDCECAICKASEDERCAGVAIGTTEDGARVCAACARGLESEAFKVVYDSRVADEAESSVVATRAQLTALLRHFIGEVESERADAGWGACVEDSDRIEALLAESRAALIGEVVDEVVATREKLRADRDAFRELLVRARDFVSTVGDSAKADDLIEEIDDNLTARAS